MAPSKSAGRLVVFATRGEGIVAQDASAEGIYSSSHRISVRYPIDHRAAPSGMRRPALREQSLVRQNREVTAEPRSTQPQLVHQLGSRDFVPGKCEPQHFDPRASHAKRAPQTVALGVGGEWGSHRHQFNHLKLFAHFEQIA